MKSLTPDGNNKITHLKCSGFHVLTEGAQQVRAVSRDRIYYKKSGGCKPSPPHDKME